MKTQKEQEEFLDKMVKLNKEYREGMLALFKAAGIPESDFVEPPVLQPTSYYRVRVEVNDRCIAPTHTDYLSADGVIRYYRVHKDGSPFVIAGNKAEWFCKTLQEAYVSYERTEVDSLNIEEVLLLFEPSYNPKAID